ncbi:MAG: hypothetical protein Q4P18_07065 [Methanobrevibacter sp.]|uniref:hypothetical protein n=1 Tax=Methanobrevibacter sp. TaxID=66852 RepID=UPI0026E04C2C|nr:hypothetical protein [Methanobrevibacter sp.]MDO5849274.1 hypothetical protein [Methanobrevibacter sp.]MDO5849277.1 hypothetical protein [Methanobrevibacter sp.]
MNVVYRKLAEIQRNLPNYDIDEETPLNVVLSILKNECFEKELSLWFNIIEDALILKVKSWNNEYGELNVRIPTKDENDYEELKLQVLRNTFLIYKSEVPSVNATQKECIEMKEDETPRTIEKMKEILEDKGIPTTRRNIALELGKHDISSDAMTASREFLKQFSTQEII